VQDDELARRYRAWRERSLGAVTERLEVAAVLEVLAPMRGERVMEPVDPLLARLGTFGAAFVVVEGVKTV
jgi:hypothetical protein